MSHSMACNKLRRLLKLQSVGGFGLALHKTYKKILMQNLNPSVSVCNSYVNIDVNIDVNIIR